MTAMARTRPAVTSPELRIAIERRLRILEDQVGAVQRPANGIVREDVTHKMIEARIRALTLALEVITRTAAG